MNIRDKYLKLTSDNIPKEYANLNTLVDDSLHWNKNNELELEAKMLNIAKEYVDNMLKVIELKLKNNDKSK